MTLPTEGDQSAGASNGQLRPASKVVRKNETYVIENIKWNQELEHGLVNCGLLDGQRLELVSNPFN